MHSDGGVLVEKRASSIRRGGHSTAGGQQGRWGEEGNAAAAAYMGEGTGSALYMVPSTKCCLQVKRNKLHFTTTFEDIADIRHQRTPVAILGGILTTVGVLFVQAATLLQNFLPIRRKGTPSSQLVEGHVSLSILVLLLMHECTG